MTCYRPLRNLVHWLAAALLPWCRASRGPPAHLSSSYDARHVSYQLPPPPLPLALACRYLAFHFPFIAERSLLRHLRACPWRVDQMAFKVRAALKHARTRPKQHAMRALPACALPACRH